MKYIKPDIKVIEVEEHFACECGSNCMCSERAWWKNKCDCKNPWWWPFSTDIDNTTSSTQEQESNSLWDNQW